MPSTPTTYLTPPQDGYSGVVEEGIMEFLESRIGSFDLFAEIENGEPFIRYCFEREADAEAFHALFGPAAALRTGLRHSETEIEK